MKLNFSPSQHLRDVSKRWRDALRPKREDAARADALSVGLAQPHRQGSDDPRLESPLGRFCASAGLHGDLYRAGCRYRDIVLEARHALGIPTAGWNPGSSGYTEGMDDLQAARRMSETRAKQDEADRCLKRVARNLPSAMQSLCVLEVEHNQAHKPTLVAGLVALHSLFSSARKKSA